MREYETTYILDPNMTDADVGHAIDRVKEIIVRHSGEVFRLQNMGKKTLAYRIKKQSKGTYVSFDFCGDSGVVADIERTFKLDERVLRYLTVVLVDDVNPEARKKQIVEEAEELEKAMAAAVAKVASEKVAHDAAEIGTGVEHA